MRRVSHAALAAIIAACGGSGAPPAPSSASDYRGRPILPLGFTFVESLEFLPDQHVIVFAR